MLDKSHDPPPPGQLWRRTAPRGDSVWLGPLPEPSGVVRWPVGTGNIHARNILYMHAAPIAVSLCSVLCRVWEWHTDQEPGLYFQYQWTYGGCGRVKMFQRLSADGGAAVHAETLWRAVVCHRLECSKCQCIPLWLIISNKPDLKAQKSQWCHLDGVLIKSIVRWRKHQKNPNVFYTCCMIF